MTPACRTDPARGAEVDINLVAPAFLCGHLIYPLPSIMFGPLTSAISGGRQSRPAGC